MLKLRLPPFENVVANSTAVCSRLPRGMMYQAICFTLGGGNTQANMLAIRVLVNGKIVWNISGADLDALNNYDRLQDTATQLTLWLGDPTIQDPIPAQIGCLDTTQGVEELSLEVDLGAGASPTLSAFYLALPPSPKGDLFAGVFKSVLRTTHAVAAAVTQANLQLALGSRAGGFLRRVALFTANTTRFSVKRDGVNLQDDLTIAEINYGNGQRWRTSQTGLLMFDPMSQCAAEDMIPTLRSDGTVAPFEFLVTTSGAETIRAYSELIASLDRV